MYAASDTVAVVMQVVASGQSAFGIPIASVSMIPLSQNATELAFLIRRAVRC
jgi:hypothetical protein